jgi:hypothetical protein
MLMADTMAIFFVVLGFLLAFPGFWLLCRGLWPSRVASAADTCGKGLLKPFLIGLPVTMFALVATLVTFNLMGGFGKMVGIGIACLYLIHAHTGVSGLATCIGQRLASKIDSEQSWRTTLRGGTVLELTYLLPILGWFVILPISFIIGSGSSTLSLLKRRAVVTKLVLPSPVGDISEVTLQVRDVVGTSR